MANTTSGTATFDKTFAIDEIVEEAHERIGLQNVAGYQLKSARRSLNILFPSHDPFGVDVALVPSSDDLKKSYSACPSIKSKSSSSISQ